MLVRTDPSPRPFSPRRAQQAAADQVLFKIGLVADVQYADADDATSFHGALRFYRNSLAGLRRALRAFESERVAAAVNLGDAVDGKMRGCPGGAAAGFDDVMACFQGRPFPSYQMVGRRPAGRRAAPWRGAARGPVRRPRPRAHDSSRFAPLLALMGARAPTQARTSSHPRRWATTTCTTCRARP